MWDDGKITMVFLGQCDIVHSANGSKHTWLHELLMPQVKFVEINFHWQHFVVKIDIFKVMDMIDFMWDQISKDLQVMEKVTFNGKMTL